MPRKISLLALACALFTLLGQAAASDIIPAGTILQCTIDEPNFSSKTAMVGDPILCHLSSLSSFGRPIFPRGAMLSGHLEDYKNPGHFVGKGKLQLVFDRIVLPGAEVLPLSAKIISAPHMKVDKQGDIDGKGHPKRDAVEWMIPVLWPIKVITLPARGPYPTLKGESRLALRLMDDVEFPVAQSSIPMPPRAANPSSYQSYGYSGSLPTPVRKQSPVQPASYTTLAAPPRSPSTVIALKDGSALLAAQYWLQGGKMNCVSSSGEQKQLPLDEIDLPETVRVNHERNTDFVLESRDVVEQ